jgi:hypothetical protein
MHYIQRQVLATFEEDLAGMCTYDLIGAGCRPAGDALRQRGEGLRTERVEGGRSR